MTDINTPEGRKALRDAYERWADYGGDFPDVDDLAISVPALLDALETELRRVDDICADRDEREAALKAEITRLRERLERVDKAARSLMVEVDRDKPGGHYALPGWHSVAKLVDALRAALEPTK